jgi:hypothetical protein
VRQIIATLHSELEAVEPELTAAQERLRLVSDKAELIKRLLAMYESEGEAEKPDDAPHSALPTETEAEIDPEEATLTPRPDRQLDGADGAETPYRATFRGFKGLVATRS